MHLASWGSAALMTRSPRYIGDSNILADVKLEDSTASDLEAVTQALIPLFWELNRASQLVVYE